VALCSSLGNKNSDAGHIWPACRRFPHLSPVSQVPQPWLKRFVIMRVQKVKVCKCKVISAVICVVSLSSVQKSEIFVNVLISSWLMLLCEQFVILYRRMFISTYLYAV